LKYSKSKAIILIDKAVSGEDIDDFIIDDVDQFIDILDHYANSKNIKWPSHIINLNKINASILVHEIKVALGNRYKTEDIINFIDSKIKDVQIDTNMNLDAKLDNNDQLVDILEHFEKKYNIKIPMRLLSNPSIGYLAQELYGIKFFNTTYEYVLIYAKMSENKQTKETVLEGPFFGEQTHTKEEIDKKAKELVEAQQGSALLIKIYKRDGRLDNELMDLAKKFYNRIYNELQEEKL